MNNQQEIRDKIIADYKKKLDTDRLSKHHVLAPLASYQPKNTFQPSNSQETLLTQLTTTKETITKHIIDVETQLTHAFKQLHEINLVVHHERKHLETLYDTEIPANDITTLIKLRQNKRYELEAELEEKKKRVLDEISREKNVWESEKTHYIYESKKTEAALKTRLEELEKAYHDQESSYADKLKMLEITYLDTQRSFEENMSHKQTVFKEKITVLHQEINGLEQQKKELLSFLESDSKDHKQLVETEKATLTSNWKLEKANLTLAHKDEMASLNTQISETKEKLETSLRTLTEKTAAATANYEDAIARMAHDLDTYKTEIDQEKQTYLKEFDQRKTFQETALEQEKRQVKDALANHKHIIEHDLSLKKETVESLEASLNEREKRVKSIERELVTLRSKVEDIDNLLYKAVQEAKETTKKVADSAHQREVALLKGQFKTQLDDIKQALTTAKIYANTKDNVIENLQDKLDQAETKIDQLVSKAVTQMLPTKPETPHLDSQLTRNAMPKILRSFRHG